MPTYDYECGACEHAWELFQPMSAKPVRKCPECGKLKAERLIGTGGGILFKGSGFYETDYRSASYKKGAKAEKKATEKKAESKKADSKKPDSSGSTKTDK